MVVARAPFSATGSFVSTESPAPETRLSLLVRIRSADDCEAWLEFVDLYTPVIFRTARCLGLQPADADDVVQQVLISVARSLQQRPHDPQRAKFRTWLGRVTRNATINALTRAKPDRGSGDSAQLRRLAMFPAAEVAEAILVRETEREIFFRAAAEVQREFASDTWQAFWLTAIEGREIEQVASELEKLVGSVYASRSRVMRRLRQVVQSLQAEESVQAEDGERGD